jgi:hypothetical protein
MYRFRCCVHYDIPPSDRFPDDLRNLGVSPLEKPEPIRGRRPPQEELTLELTPESGS